MHYRTWRGLVALVAVSALTACVSLVPYRSLGSEGSTVGETFKRQGQWSFYFVDEASKSRMGLKASGVYEDDRQTGDWSYWYPNGQLRWQTSFSLASGLDSESHFWHETGEKLAQGSFEGGIEHGRWNFYDEEGLPTVSGEYDLGRQTGTWTYWYEGGTQKAAEGRRDGTQMAGDWQYWDANGSALDSVPAPVATALGQRPVIPVIAQPELTNSETNKMGALIAYYEDADEGDRLAQQLASLDSDYGAGKTRLRPRREDLSNQAEGISLAGVTVVTGSGDEVTVGQLIKDSGCRNAVVVVLRGMQNEVCAYCIAQTTGLVNRKRDFDALNTEVIVIYPGDQRRGDEFLDLYMEVQRGFQEEGVARIPYSFVSDPELAMPRLLKAEANMSLPASMITNSDGEVMWAFVSAGVEERPSARVLRKQVERLQSEL